MMNFRNSFHYKVTVLSLLMVFFQGSYLYSQGQDLKFAPKGNPDKWNFNITPFFILPWVNGNVQSELLSKEFGITPSDFITTLNGTFMIDAELSKGKFFAAPSYIFNYNEVSKVIWTSENGNQTITAQPGYQRHILEVIAGMRFRLGAKFILDPCMGFRYTHYRLFGEVEGIANVSELDEKVDFWDPVLGFKAHFYPIPRLPVELKTDVGGFGVGSKLTWSVWLNSGYTVAPAVDIIAGFGALSYKYENETNPGRDYGMTSITYGVTFGARFYIPSRVKDPLVFLKFAEK
jgi:hypothetical protein